jgi:3-hydroxybutyryl-CoA dehydrogenase
MGPFTLLDFVGIETTYLYLADSLQRASRQALRASSTHERMVMAGMYGRKAGKGFYMHADPKNPKPNRLLGR